MHLKKVFCHGNFSPPPDIILVGTHKVTCLRLHLRVLEPDRRDIEVPTLLVVGDRLFTGCKEYMYIFKCFFDRSGSKIRRLKHGSAQQRFMRQLSTEAPRGGISQQSIRELKAK